MRNLWLILVISVVVSCGVKESKEPPPPLTPNLDSLLIKGWVYYSEGKFDTAKQIFDSVLMFDVYNFDALIGGGWSSIHLGEYLDAHTYLGLALTVKGGSPVFKSPEASFEYDTTINETLRVGDEIKTVVYKMKPAGGNYILALDELECEYKKPYTIYRDTCIFYDTVVVGTTVVVEIDTLYRDTVEAESVFKYEVAAIFNDCIWLTWSSENDTNVVPRAPASVTVSSYYIVGEPDSLQAEAFAGECASYVYEGEYFDAVKNGNAVIYINPSYVTKYKDYVTFDIKSVRLLLAKSYMELGLYKNVEEELKALDSSWEPPSPSSSDYLYQLYKKLGEMSLGSL